MRYDEARLERHAAWLHLIINVIMPSTFLIYSRLTQEDSLPLQGQPSADLDSGSPGFFGAYGQHLPKPSSHLRVVGWEDVGMCVGASLAALLRIQEEPFILRSPEVSGLSDGINSRTLHTQVT